MPTLTRDLLLADLYSAGKPREQWRVGAEFERHLLQADGSPLPYFGDRGVRWLLEQLPAHGYRLEFEGDNPIAAFKGQHSITLEPGSQWELSGSADAELQPILDEASELATLTDALLEGTGVRQVALGYTPFSAIDDIPWVPKGRYAVMKDYLIKVGDLSHGMMKGTCATQATYDFKDEVGCARKVRLATALGPLTTAMFANSPFKEGRPSGFISYRGHIWTRTDPARAGMPDAAADFDFEKWIDYLLDVPMMFRKDAEGRWSDAQGETFGQWLISNDPPNWKDWELHLTSVFPEVRVKRTIEVRGADCVPLPLAMSFVALFKGLFYCDLAQEHAAGLAERFTDHGSRADRFDVACRHGLEGSVGGRRLADWSDELVDICDQGLQRCSPADRVWLRPLMDQIATGESPGRTLLRALGEQPTPEALFAHTSLLP